MATKNEKAILKVGADASQAKEEIRSVATTAKQTASEVNAAGASMGQAFTPVENSAAKAAQATARQVNAFTNIIKRAQAETATLGKMQSDRLEKLAELKFGSVPASLAGELARLREFEAAAASTLTKTGMTAKATSAALRQVPAQFTDIVVSLQGGQAPLTVLLQQGGQLRDIFGSAGAAARALGSYVLGLVNPFTVAAAAVGSIGYAYYAGSQEAEAFNKALILTGNRAGTTAGQLAEVAQGMSKFGVTQGKAAEALTQLANSGLEGQRALTEGAAAAITWEKATGTAIEKVGQNFKDLRKAPLETTQKLNEELGYMTVALYQQIKALEDQGKAAQAADLAQKAYYDTIESRGQAVLQNLGFMERGWNAVASAAKGAWDAAKGIGRATTLEDQIAALQAKRNQYKEQGYNTDEEDKVLAGMTKRLMLQRDAAQVQAQSVAQAEALAKWDKAGNEYLDKKVKLENEIKKVREEGAAAGVKQAEIETRIAAVREKYKDKTPKAEAPGFAQEQAKLYAKSIEDFEKAAIKAQVQVDGLTTSQGHLVELLLNPAFQSMPETWKQTVLQTAHAAIAQEQLADEVKRTNKAIEEAEKGRLKDIDALRKQGAELEQQVAKQKLHNDSIGKTAEEIGRLTAQRELDNAAILEAAAIKELDHNYDMEKYEATMKVVRALREKAKAEQEGGRLQAIQDEAKKAEAEWKRVSDEINRALTDSLMRAFEGGESFAGAFAKTVEAMFKTMVLRPVVSAVMNPVSQVVSSTLGSLGIPGIGNAATSAATSGVAATGLTGQFVSGFTGSAGAAAELMGGAELTAAAQAGAAAAMAAPYVLGAVALKALTDYKVEAKGNYLVANVSGKGLDGQVASRSDFTQSSSGFLSGGTTQNSDWARAGDAVDTYINTAVKTATDAAKRYAAALGLPVDALDGFKKQIEVSITGLDAAGQKEAIDKAVASFAADMVQSAYGASITGLAKEGETSAQTLERVATNLTAVNLAFDKLGISIEPVSAEAAATATSLVEAFGGLDKASTAFTAYYDKFYSDAEKAAYATESLAKQFEKLGLEVPGTEADFRDLVDSIDLTTESGRTLAAAVLDLAPAFSAAATAAKTAAANMLSAIQNWGTSADVRQFKAQQLQQTLAAGGLTLDLNTILGATKDSVLAYYNSLEATSPVRQLLLDNQQAIYDLVNASSTSATTGSDTGGYSGGGGSAGQTAANEIESAWQAITDSIWGEVKRIRGLLEGTGTEALAAAQARFTLATAQARAGDQQAASALPDLSKNLLLLAEANAKTLVELKTIQGQTSGSLAETGTLLALRYGLTIPQFSTGTNYTQEGLAYLHEGEAVVPKAFNPVAGGLDQGDLIAEIRELRRQVADLQAAAAVTANATTSTARTLDTVTEGGRAMQTEAYT